MPGAKRLSMGRDAGSHSVHRIVGYFTLSIDGLVRAGHSLENLNEVLSLLFITGFNDLRKHSKKLSLSLSSTFGGLGFQLCFLNFLIGSGRLNDAQYCLHHLLKVLPDSALGYSGSLVDCLECLHRLCVGLGRTSVRQNGENNGNNCQNDRSNAGNEREEFDCAHSGFIFSPNVRDHRRLPVARSVPGEERAQARSVTRVGVLVDRIVSIFIYLILFV